MSARAGRHPQEEVRPGATYAPWLSDPDFQRAMAEVKDHTLVDIYRCWELWCLVEQSRKVECGDNGAIIEIGCWRGGSGALMARRAKLLGMQEKVILVDGFKGVVKVGFEDPDYIEGEHADASVRMVDDLLTVMELPRAEVRQAVFPDDCPDDCPDDWFGGARFRLCHIDVDAYQSAKDATSALWSRMPPGGIIVYDDYGFSRCGGVTTLVEEQRALPDRLVLHNLNGHAVVVKLWAVGLRWEDFGVDY